MVQSNTLNVLGLLNYHMLNQLEVMPTDTD